MEVWRGRRLMTAAFVFIVSFSLCALLPFSFFCYFALTAFLLFALYSFYPKRKNARFRLSLLVLLTLSFLLGGLSSARFRYALAPSIIEGEERFYFGTVKSVISEQPYRGSYLLCLRDENGRPFLCLSESDEALGFSAGDEVRVTGAAGYMTDSYYLSDNVRACLFASSGEIVAKGEEKTPFFRRLNARSSDILKSRLGEEAGALAPAILLGNREKLDGHIRLTFRRIGFSHVLAVSGLHVSVLLTFFSLLFRLVPVNRRIRKLLLVPAVLFLVCITGAPASVVRASAMFAGLMIPDLLYEEKDTVTALFCAVSSILLVNPPAFYDLGLWLSFSATLGIVLFSSYFQPFNLNVRKDKRYLQWLSKAGNFVLSLLMTGLCSSVFTLPVLCLSYQTVSLIAPLTSLLLIPIVTVLLPVFLLVLLLGWVPGLGFLLSFTADTMTRFLLSASERLADWDGICLSLSYPLTGWFVAALTLILVLLFFTKHFKVWMALVCTVCLCVCFGFYVRGEENRVKESVCVSALNDARNDSIVLRYHASVAVIDITGGSYSCARSYSGEVYDLCDDRIDALVFTHLHSYHALTLHKIASYIKIDSVYYPAPMTESERETAALLTGAAEELGIGAHCYYENASLSLDDLKINLPGRLFLERSAHPVITFSVSRGEEELLRYLGAGLEEMGIFEMPTREGEAVLFGSHGPLRKREIEESRPFLSLGDAADYTAGEEETELRDGSMTMIFPKNE